MFFAILTATFTILTEILFFIGTMLGPLLLEEVKTNAVKLHISQNNEKHGLKPLDNIGKTKKQKCSQIYT